MLAGRFVVLVVSLAWFTVTACGDDGAGPIDGSTGGEGSGSGGDAPIDLLIVTDIDNGSCGNQVRLTGEYVDWDTDASFCGIHQAVLEVVVGGQMDSTAPNGRFDLCTPETSPTSRLDITQPSGNSACTIPAAMYTIPTILVSNIAVIQSGAFYSARSWTTTRQTTLFTQIGQAFDGAKGQVLVHVHGMQRAVTLSATHGPAQAVTTTVWAPGTTGHDVFFPNVDIGTGVATLSVAGGAVGTGAIPVIAGTITNVTVHAP